MTDQDDVLNSNDLEVCASCKRPLVASSPVTIWDRKPYCCICVENAGFSAVGPANSALEEDYRFGFWNGLGLGLYTGFLITTGLALGLFAMFLLLYVAFLMGGLKQNPAQPDDFIRQLRTFALFFTFAWAFVGVIGIPMGLFGTLFALRRTIQVKDGLMIYNAGLRHVAIPLSECYWQVSSICMDAYTIVSLKRPSIIVRTAKDFIICGFTLESLRFWNCYLSLAVGPATPKHNWHKNWRDGLFHVIFGCVAGWLVGRFMQAMTGHPMWTTAVTFVGILDGLISGGFALLKGHAKAKLLVVNPWIFSLILATLGAKIGIAAGWPGLVVCFIGNGIVGWGLGKLVHRQFNTEAANASPVTEKISAVESQISERDC